MNIRLGKLEIIFLSVLISFAIFGPSLYFQFFIFDDAELIFQNLKVAKATWVDVFNHWALSNTPIIYNVWQFVSMIFGVDDALPYRFLNIAFHSINSFLVYIWSKNLLQAYFKEDMSNGLVEKAAFFGFLFYLVHPVHVEAVVWVASLKEVLSTTFALVSFIFYLKNNASPRIYTEALTLVFYLLGMLTHPTIAALPLVYIWLDFLLFKKEAKEVFFRNGVYFLLLTAAVVIHKTVNPEESSNIEQPLFLRIAVAFNALFEYLQKSFFPTSYSFDYMMTPQDVSEGITTLMWPKIKAFLTAAFAWLLIISYKNKKFHFFHLPVSLIVLLVMVNLGLVGYSFQSISTIADRFLYFPTIGVSLFVSFIFLSFDQNSKILKIAKPTGVVIFLLFLGMSIHRVYLWRSNDSLLEGGIKNGYVSYPLTLSLGVSLAEDKKYDQALLKFEEAYKMTLRKDKNERKKILANGTEALSHMFRVYKAMGDKEQGVKLYLDLITNGEVDPELAWFMADYFVSINRWYEAEKLIQYVSGLYPNYPTLKEMKKQIPLIKENSLFNSYLNLGIYEIDQKNMAAARVYLERSRELSEKLKLKNDKLDELLELTKE